MKGSTPVIILAGLLSGFLAGYQFRGTEKRPAVIIGAAEQPSTQGTASLRKETGKPAPEPAKTAALTSPADLSELLSQAVESRRILGILSLVNSTPDSGLESLARQFLERLNSGQLSVQEFQLAVEVLGERGSRSAALALVENKTALKNFPGAFTGFFTAWARRNSKEAWAFCTSQFVSNGSPVPEALLKGVAGGCEPDAPELQAMVTAAKLEPDRIAMWRVAPVVRTSGFSGAVEAVRKRITDNATEQTAFNEVAAIGSLVLEAGRDAIDQAAKDLSKGGRLGPNTFPEPAGSLIHDWARKSPEETLEWAKTQPSGGQRSLAMGFAIFQQGMKDPDKALNSAKGLPIDLPEERLNVLMGLQDAFRQTTNLTADERKDLIQQTEALIEDAKKGKK